MLSRARYARGLLALRVFCWLARAEQDPVPELHQRPPSELNALLALKQLGFGLTNAVQIIVDVDCDGQSVILGLQTSSHDASPLKMRFCPNWSEMQAVLSAHPLSHLAWLDADPLVGLGTRPKKTYSLLSVHKLLHGKPLRVSFSTEKPHLAWPPISHA